jgi:hypothetical protein
MEEKQERQQEVQGGKGAGSDVEAAMARKDALIAELQQQLSEAREAGEVTAAELARLRDAHAAATAKYLEAVRLANSHLPAEVISGSSIEEIDASVQRARVIAESVKKLLAAQSTETRVPAGAPPRTQLPLEMLSPRDKIIAGIQQKGGKRE